jgi:hypothetical protein
MREIPELSLHPAGTRITGMEPELICGIIGTAQLGLGWTGDGTMNSECQGQKYIHIHSISEIPRGPGGGGGWGWT